MVAFVFVFMCECELINVSVVLIVICCVVLQGLCLRVLFRAGCVRVCV